MREIIFRGKSSDGFYYKKGSWVYGGFMPYPNESLIITDAIEEGVDPETVGQYTGLKDKNGKMIFEGDIIAWKHPVYHKPMEVMFHNASFVLVGETLVSIGQLSEKKLEVIGNIHDNPELLEDKEVGQ
jgi:hypothetical protein